MINSCWHYGSLCSEGLRLGAEFQKNCLGKPGTAHEVPTVSYTPIFWHQTGLFLLPFLLPFMLFFLQYMCVHALLLININECVEFVKVCLKPLQKSFPGITINCRQRTNRCIYVQYVCQFDTACGALHISTVKERCLYMQT